jgi:hypothetical protein
MARRPIGTALVLLAGGALCACAAKQPVLYPNAHLKQVGREAGQVDIEECMQLAESGVGDRNRAAGAAGRSAAGAAGGAAMGAVGGAITGNAGIGAAVGAATGATGGLLSGLWSFRDRDPTFMNFVDTCLRERGYQPIGWR